MTEQLLQYIWHLKMFQSFDFKDTQNNALEIIDFGQWNGNAGADFQLAKIRINGVILVGNIELHTKSSHYITHKHSQNSAYDNLILHAVYEEDTPIPELNEKGVPTLVLKPYIDERLLEKYDALLHNGNFIPCESIFDEKALPILFSEELLLKKLDEKSEQLALKLSQHKNDYEAVLFHQLAYAFGLKINAEIFQQITESIDFSVIKKIQQNSVQLEALLFGISGWLTEPLDKQTALWKREFEFLKSKYQLSDITISPKFLRLRPPNFPTIRLSQLTSLYHRHPNLFSKIINAKNTAEIQHLFEEISASAYWDNHFVFGKISEKYYQKKLSKDFINLIIINAILPLKYHYFKNINENIAEEILDFYKALPPETNSLIDNWKKIGAKIETALHSQAFLFLYKNFCNQKKCLNCSFGYQLLKNKK